MILSVYGLPMLVCLVSICKMVMRKVDIYHHISMTDGAFSLVSISIRYS